ARDRGRSRPGSHRDLLEDGRPRNRSRREGPDARPHRGRSPSARRDRDERAAGDGQRSGGPVMTAATASPEPDISGTVFDESTAEHARAYADALINAAGKDAEAAVEELGEIVADVIHGHPRFAAILGGSGPAIPEKDRILVEVFE